MRRTAAVLVTATVAAGLASGAAAAAPAAAATAPTVTAPAIVDYYSVASVSGTTPSANQRVVVYIRTAAGGRRAARDLHSDATGHFATTIRAAVSFSVDAVAGGRDSAVRTVRIRTASCTYTRPIARNPITAQQPTPIRPGNKVMALTATYGGLWAGYAYDVFPLQFDVISWHAGQAVPTVLRTYKFSKETVFYPSADGTVSVAGVTPAGAVVAGIRLSPEQVNFIAHAWYRGTMYNLSHAANWTSTQPIGTTSTGAVIGVAHTGTEDRGTWYLVRWSSITAHYQVLQTFTHSIDAKSDAAGDVVYGTQDGSTHLRYASGETRSLLAGDGQQLGVVWTSAGRRFYLSTSSGTAEFVVSPSTGPGPEPALTATAFVASEAGFGSVNAASSRGDLIFNRGRSLRTAGGALAAVPGLRTDTGVAGSAINSAGTFSVTTSDGLVHLGSCH
jgi:hypothetical protein